MLVALAAIYLVWSTTYLAIRIVVHALPPLGSSSARFLIAGTIGVAVARVLGAKWPTAAELRSSLLVGVLLFCGGNGLVALALREASSGLATLVVATVPVFTGLLLLLFGQRLARREWLGVALGLAGVLVLVLDKQLYGSLGSLALLVLSPLLWSLGTILSTRWPAPRGLMAPAVHMLGGGFALGVSAWLMGERFPATLPLEGVLGVAYLIVFGSFVGYGAYAYLVAHARPTVATSYAFVNPVLAIALGATFAGEPVPAAMGVSVVLVLAALALVLGAGRRKRAAT